MLSGIGKGTITREEVSADYLKSLFAKYGVVVSAKPEQRRLLERVNAIPGEFLIRFMTSHPKDATQKLFETMARCEKVAPVLHLPFQAGSDRVLKAMNRGYTREQYLEKVRMVGPKPFLLAGVLALWLIGGGYFVTRFILSLNF